jgi:hypothetical protein
MTTNDQLAARVQRKALEQVQGLPDSPEARARTVAALEAAMKDAAPVAPSARVGRAGPLALAAGLALLLGAGWLIQTRTLGVGSVVASTGTLEPGHRLANAEVIDTGQAEMTLQLAHGVRVLLRAESSVELRDEGARVVVRRGEVAAEVTSGEAPFFLDSSDAHVATRGARFSVKSGAGCDGRTQVSVTEGLVTVDGSPVPAGATWPQCAAAIPEPTPTPAPVVVAPAPEPVRPQQVTKRMTPPPLVKDDERLSRQNELYLQAITLQRAGDVNGAVKKLEAVLEDSKSPLAETALAQKMRWLSATDRGGAREVAREYLQRFPMGFGRAEAETLVLEPR